MQATIPRRHLHGVQRQTPVLDVHHYACNEDCEIKHIHQRSFGECCDCAEYRQQLRHPHTHPSGCVTHSSYSSDSFCGSGELVQVYDVSDLSHAHAPSVSAQKQARLRRPSKSICRASTINQGGSTWQREPYQRSSPGSFRGLEQVIRSPHLLCVCTKFVDHLSVCFAKCRSSSSSKPRRAFWDALGSEIQSRQKLAN